MTGAAESSASERASRPPVTGAAESSASELASVAVPATTANLGPGFDSFGAALGLRATFTAVDPSSQDVLIRTHGRGADDDLPTGEDNLVWSSLVAACEEFGWDVPDVGIVVDTPIPQARGMGSSSAAIVGGIALARVLAGADASVAVADHAVGDRDLVRFATGIEGHPDNVAPAILGGLVACAVTDDGDLVTRLSPPPAGRPVLLVPSVRSLTVEARGAVPDALDRGDVIGQVARAGHVLAGLTGAWPVDARLSGDRLHEPPRLAALDEGRGLVEAVRAAGRHAWLSGAGPAIAVVLPARDDAALAEVTDLAKDADHEVLALAWDRQGIRSCVPGGCGVAGTPGCADCPLPSLR